MFKNSIVVIILICILSADESWKVYDDSSISTINITINPNTLDWIYNNVESDSLHSVIVHFQNEHITETIDSVGFRLRGNTSRTSAKKSFKLDFNHFISGRDFYNIEKLNLNGEHNDPSIVRSKICWDIYNESGIIAPRAAHAKVYINDNYYGLYISVEHIDDSFLKKNFNDDSGNLWKCLWPADLTYRGENPENYYPYYGDDRPYELKTNTDNYDYEPLANLINILHHNPESLESVLDIKSTLQYFAMNILLGSWDDYRYLRNNFYLYHNPSDDLIYWIPYDYDNTFGIDWFNIDWSSIDPYTYNVIDNDGRPLTDYLFSLPRYRTILTHFMSFYNNNLVNLDSLNAGLEEYQSSLLSAVQEDYFRTLDYGFTNNDFIDSYGENYSNQHVKQGIKEFIISRNLSLNQQLIFDDNSPIIYDVDVSHNIAIVDQEIEISVAMFNEVEHFHFIYARTDDLEWQTIDMNYLPDSTSKYIEDHDRWIIDIIYEEIGTYVWYLSATNSHGTERFPKFGFKDLQIIPQAQIPTVIINELLAKNETVNSDEQGEFDDWLELWNYGLESIDLSNYFLTDNPNNSMKWNFPSDAIIAPNEYKIIWCDEDQEQGAFHTNFKLSSSGEYLALIASDGFSIIDSLTFPQQDEDISFGRLNNFDASWDYMSPTPGSINELLSIQDTFYPENFKILKLFPNPFNSNLNIELDINFDQKDIKIHLYSLLGALVATKNFKVNRTGVHSIPIDFSSNDMSSGVYLLRVESGNFIKSKKLIYMK
mgnify:FL=1